MSRREEARGDLNRTPTELDIVEQVYQHLKDIFPTVARDTQLEAKNLPSTVVDLLALSTNGRLILFEVKALPSDRNLTYSVYPSVAALKESVSHISQETPPIVVLITTGLVPVSVRNVFEQSGIPVITPGKNAMETAQHLSDAFETQGIAIPELTPRFAPTFAAIRESLSIGLVPAYNLERLAEYNSDLQTVNLLQGSIMGILVGFLVSWFTSYDPVIGAPMMVIAISLAIAFAFTSAWRLRIRARIRATMEEIKSEKPSARLPISREE